MDELKTFILAADRVTEFSAFFSGIADADHTIHTLNIQKEEFSVLWTTLRSAYDTLQPCLEKLDKKTIESAKKKFFTTYKAYTESLSKANEIFENLTKPFQSKQTVDPCASGPNISLPPCDTEIFYGDYSSWPYFRDMFSALYKDNPKLNPVEKLCHLLKKTKGEAHEILKTCPLSNDGFDMAWKNLTDRYENKRVLVNAQLKILLNLSPIKEETGPNIKTVQRTINDCVTNLNLLKIDTQNWDVIFVYLCSKCLPDVSLNLWQQSLRSNSDLPTWKEMDSFLTSRYQTLESVADIRTTTYEPIQNRKPIKQKYIKNQETKKLKSYHNQVNHEKTKCVLCDDFHPLRLCSIFLKMSAEERYNTAKKEKRCLNCLATSHDIKQCKSKYRCSICKQKHHSLLHRTTQTFSQERPSQAYTKNSGTPLSWNTGATPRNNNVVYEISNFDGPSTSAAAEISRQQSFSTRVQNCPVPSVVLGTALVDICINNVRITVRALIDSASEASFISKALQQRLLLPSRLSQTQIIGLNGALTAISQHVCDIIISSPLEKSFQLPATAFVVRKLTDPLPYYPQSTSKTKFRDLCMADNFHIRSNVDILLGADIYPKILREGIRWDDSENLVAQQTVFGWIITGRVLQPIPNQSVSTFFNKVALESQLTKFWELENIPEVTKVSDDDQYCEKYYKTTTFRNNEGRFVVSLPFRKDFPEKVSLGPSRNKALSQFWRNEARLLKTPDIKSEYDKVIAEYSTLGHMTQVSDHSITTQYYLPHHAVFKPESASTKLRVVFNASSATSNGLSLNDVLYPGPTLQADLTILIIRWRLFKYVFNADIEKMYRQILVNPIHTPFQRILFRSQQNEPVKDFELNTVTFGVNCAPYLAIRTLLELAEQCVAETPKVADVLRNYMYVDDVLYGSHEIHDAIQSRNQLIKALSSAGFSLRKWTANHEALLEDIPHEHLLDTGFLKLSESSTTKTLGLRWNAGGDFFYFKPSRYPDRNSVTKRAVLSEIARLFDPAGWLSPKIVVAKIIMQCIWKDGTDWDESLKPQTLHQWHTFLDDYPYIAEIKIPRFLNYDPSYKLQLHGFCDASEKAYAATLYLRTETPSGDVYTTLIISKTKVAPVKFLSLPRKELCGAVLMAKLLDSIQSQLNIGQYKSFLWTDSTIVLAWLQQPDYLWKTFVANRVSFIQEKTTNSTWSHVDSKDNPADLASRGITAKELTTSSFWWNGPPWLKLPQPQWPSTVYKLETQEEARPIQSHTTRVLNSFDILTRFSSLHKAMRVLCYVFRFFHACSSKYKYRYESLEILQTEISRVKHRLVILCQKLHFPEYETLEQSQKLSSKSSLLPLNPFIDAQGIMRVNGRLSLSPTLSYDEKFPKILPYTGRFTRLYLEMLHKFSVHGENSLLMRLMRMEFWVPKLRNLAKSVVRSCKTCTLYKRFQSRQIMAALPPERLTLSRPFTNTGVDFCGPFEIKSYFGRGCKITKGYVLVFICFATKAIHLEATSDISTQTFLAAFARFFSRRGTPKAMFSDNGTAFVGASNLLRQDQKRFLSSVRQELSNSKYFQSVDWHFIPPGAPHMGGLWEAGVKSFKTHMKKVSNSQHFTFEEFSTMLSRIEACLNSRPLTPMSMDPSDLCALTPGHFLIGGPLLSPPEADVSNLTLSHQNRWQKLQISYQNFAMRWKEEYLKEMHKRIKWKYPHRNFTVGDLVVIRQDNFPPNKWRLGRVERVIPGSDNKVRVAEVRTSSGVIVRPIVKLVLLPESPDKK